MWIFMNDSFLSIVQDTKRPLNLLVRARAKHDIGRVFPEIVVTKTLDGDHDYGYRASIPRGLVAERIGKKLSEIEYPNFKDSIPHDEDLRHSSYTVIWSIMYLFQQNSEKLWRSLVG